MKKIMVVEDDFCSAEDILGKLQSLNYSCFHAANADEAVSAFRNDSFSLAVISLNLKSEPNAVELASIIGMSYFMPVIFLSDSPELCRADALSLPSVYGCLLKPADSNSLSSVIAVAFARAAAEKSLKEQSYIFESVMENSAEGIVVTDEKLNIKYFNHIFLDLFDIQKGDIYGSSLNNVLSGHIPLFHGLIGSIADGSRGTGRTMLKMAGEKPKSILMNVSSCSIEDDRQIYLFIFSDLSELESVKKELDITTRSFDKLFEKNRDVLMLLTIPECTLTDINPAGEKMLGMKKNELLGKVPESLIRVLVENGCITSGGQNEAVCTITDSSNEQFIFLVNTQKLNIRGEEYLYISMKDITEAKKMEKRELLIHEKLIHTNRMTALGTLVSGIAHEINNPNNFIMFNSKIMIDIWQGVSAVLDNIYEEKGDFNIENLPYSTLRSDIPKLLEGIAGGSSRIRKIVGELKTFSRGETESMNNKFSLEDISASAVKITKQHIAKHTSNFSFEIDKDLPPFIGNRQKIEQILINLILNALEALPDKNGAVKLACVKGENGSIIIRVSDTGTGIPPEIISRITEPFFTTKQKEGGTGLGLSIVYTYVKEHKGELDFSSEPDKGTTVTVTFPPHGSAESENA